MHIEFTTIRWKNFLSTGNTFTEVYLDRYKNRLILGENGAGKSTLLDAVTFALFNKPFRRINKPQLINSINNKHCVVEIEFQIGQNKYLVRRGMKPNVFEIYRNDEMLNQDAANRDYQEMLEKYILKLNYKAFCQVVIIGSASFVPFMQLSAAARREVIEDILDIKIFSSMNTLLKDEVSQNKNAIRDVDYDRQLVEEKIRMFEDTEKKLQQNADNLIADYTDKIDKTQTQIFALQEEVDTVAKEVEELNKEIEDKGKIDKKLKEIEKIQYQIDQKIEKLDKDIDFYENNDECPTCKQAIDQYFKEQINNETVEKKNKYKDGLEELSIQYNKVHDRIKIINETIKLIEEKNSSITDRNYQIRSHNSYIGDLLSQINKLNDDRKNIQDNNKLIEHQKKFGELKEQYEVLKDETNVLGIASQVLKDNGIKSKIIKQYIPIMNKLINSYLQKMDFFVKFDLDENFNETILSRHRDNFTYASFSEGEKFRIDLSLLFTWRKVAKLKNSTSTNLLIMDEVFDSSLDAGGTEEFLKLINELDEKTNVFIISHKGDQLFDKFQNVLKFEKYKSFSRIAA
jgi:DNA repair exonuclease SbcCD ATPase subunit